jgi:RimJ/RimL family protein N-acetyltransferase
VGTCAFTGPPTADGEVEIAYFTFPAFERQRCASAMAAALVDIAARSADVRAVVAHTLPESNASTAILTRLGFRCVGDAHDDDAGTVWRWRLPPPA